MSVFDMCACLPKHPWLLRCRSPQASRQTPTRSLCSRSLIIHSLISPSTQERRKEYTASPLMLGETGRCWSRHWHLTRVLAPHIYEFQVHWIMQINKRALWKPSLKKKKKKKVQTGHIHSPVYPQKRKIASCTRRLKHHPWQRYWPYPAPRELYPSPDINPPSTNTIPIPIPSHQD